MGGTAKKLVAVQYARAFAALLVVFGHVLHDARNLVGTDSWLHDLSARFPFFIGVDVFFIISGFIMVYVSEKSSVQQGYGTVFLKSRIARIVPNYWFYTFLTVGLLIAMPSAFDSTQLDGKQLVYSLFFVPGIGEPIRPVLLLGWTLNFEMFFYLTFAVGLFLARRSAHLIAMGLFAGLVAFWATGQATAAPLSEWVKPIILEFCAGMILARLSLRGVRVSWTAFWGFLVAGCALAIPLSEHMTSETRVIYYGLPALLIASGFILAPHEHGIKGLGLIEKIGDASYTLYLSHPFVIAAVYLVWTKTPWTGPTSFLGFILAVFVVSIAYSFLAYRWLELPSNRLARRLLDRKRDS